MIASFLSLCFLFCWSPGANGENVLDTANKRFALDLYAKITKENQGRNVFFSPISISAAFGMVSLGARGNTKQQVKSTLHFHAVNGDDALNGAFRDLLLDLKSQNSNHTLHVANRLFGSKEFQIQERFQQDSLNFYQASLESLDFQHDFRESRRRINDWVAGETKQKIKELLPDGTVNSLTKLVIVNAIYFRAFWEYPFEVNLTRLTPFHISKSEQVNIDMMAQSSNERMNYYNSKALDCHVLEIPYHGRKVSMFIFLPHEVDGLLRIEQQLTTEIMNELLGQVEPKYVRLQLPKFTMDQDLSLKKYLQSLGVLDLFDGKTCDLSGITPPGANLVAHEAVHKAFVTVNEVGTEAGAATGVLIGLTSAREWIAINVDRPFLFLIQEKDTKTILFLGRLVRPPVKGDSIGKFGETAKLTSGDSGQLASGQLVILFNAVTLLLISFLLH